MGNMRGLSIALCGLLLLAPAAFAAGPDSAPGRTASDRVRDLETQVRARQQLAADEELAPFNLGVSVRDGVAVVWGPVPSPEVKAKALAAVENVRGIYKVKSEMYVTRNAGTLVTPSYAVTLPDVPQTSASAMPDWRTGKLPSLPGQLSSKKGDEPTGPPKSVLLLPALAAPDDGPNGELASALEGIRKGDDRYRLIQYEMKNGAIYLRGTAKPEHVMAFAQAISRVPGVERVVLQSQGTPR
jgi:osmotically-inducible protein OsmY